MVDKEDGTIIETSLREMEEELGIPPGDTLNLLFSTLICSSTLFYPAPPFPC